MMSTQKTEKNDTATYLDMRDRAYGVAQFGRRLGNAIFYCMAATTVVGLAGMLAPPSLLISADFVGGFGVTALGAAAYGTCWVVEKALQASGDAAWTRYCEKSEDARARWNDEWQARQNGPAASLPEQAAQFNAPAGKQAADGPQQEGAGGPAANTSSPRRRPL